MGWLLELCSDPWSNLPKTITLSHHCNNYSNNHGNNHGNHNYSNNHGNNYKESRANGNIANKKDGNNNFFPEMEKDLIPGTTEHGISLVSFHSLSAKALSHQKTTSPLLGQAQKGRNLDVDYPTSDKVSEVGDGHSEQDTDFGFVNKAFSSSLQCIDQNGNPKTPSKLPHLSVIELSDQHSNISENETTITNWDFVYENRNQNQDSKRNGKMTRTTKVRNREEDTVSEVVSVTSHIGSVTSVKDNVLMDLTIMLNPVFIIYGISCFICTAG